MVGYTVVLVLVVQQSESVMHINISTLFLRFLSHVGPYITGHSLYALQWFLFPGGSSATATQGI